MLLNRALLTHIPARCSREAYNCIRQHTSAYVSIRQHTSAYVSIRQATHALKQGIYQRAAAEKHRIASFIPHPQRMERAPPLPLPRPHAPPLPLPRPHASLANGNTLPAARAGFTLVILSRSSGVVRMPHAQRCGRVGERRC
jgi:hypothetical protein